MKAIRNYLDEAIRSGVVKNDAEIARRLEVNRSAVSAWRSGAKAPDDDAAMGLAQLVGRPAGELLAECAAARAKTPKARAAWERVAKMASMTSACLALAVVTTTLTPSTANASSSAETRSSTLYYVKFRNRWNRFGSRVRSLLGGVGVRLRFSG